jgi:hypothetical protein
MATTTIPAHGRSRALWHSPILLLTLSVLMWAGHSVVGRLAIGQISPMTLTCARWAPGVRAHRVRGAPLAASGF